MIRSPSGVIVFAPSLRGKGTDVSEFPEFTICIMQPSFLPWLGWFDIVDQCDSLVILDDVSFSKQSWQQRNRIRTSKGLEYLTVPVQTAGRLGQSIDQTETSGDSFVERILGKVLHAYRRAPYFDRYYPGFADCLATSATSGRLASLNVGLLRWLLAELGLSPSIQFSSQMGAKGRRGWRVADLCNRAGATRYLSPAGAEAYLREDSEAFGSTGIAVELHAYEHPEYRQQFEPFIGYASTIDLLFNEGPNSLPTVRSGRRDARPLTSRGESV